MNKNDTEQDRDKAFREAGSRYLEEHNAWVRRWRNASEKATAKEWERTYSDEMFPFIGTGGVRLVEFTTRFEKKLCETVEKRLNKEDKNQIKQTKKSIKDVEKALRAVKNGKATHWQTIADILASEVTRLREMERISSNPNQSTGNTTVCASCFLEKDCPIRNNEMGGYVCLTCVDRELKKLQFVNKSTIERIELIKEALNKGVRIMKDEDKIGRVDPRRVEWCGDMYGDTMGLHVKIHIGGKSQLVSRRLAEQIRNELTEVLNQN